MSAVADLPRTGLEWQSLREEAELTRTELAARTGLDVVTIRRLEDGARTNNSTRSLVAFALSARFVEITGGVE